MDSTDLVEDVSKKDVTAGWLTGFDVNSAQLKPPHRQWLRWAIVEPVKSNALLPTPRHNLVWVVGEASRTGPFRYNLQLSQRRAKSAARYLESQLSSASVPEQAAGQNWDIATLGAGEVPAVIKGARDDVEDALSRAVLVMHRQYDPEKQQGKPAPPKKIEQPEWKIPCCYAKQEIAYFTALQEAWSMALSHGFQDTGDGRTAKPPREWTIARLKVHGYTNDRAWELYEDGPFMGPFMRVRLEDVAGVTNRIGRLIKQAESWLEDCAPGHHPACVKSTINPKVNMSPLKKAEVEELYRREERLRQKRRLQPDYGTRAIPGQRVH